MRVINIVATLIIPAVLLVLSLVISQNQHFISLMQQHHFSNAAIAQNILMVHYM